MTEALASFQSGLACALAGVGARPLASCPLDPASAGFRFTAKVRRSWCKGRAITAAREVLALIPADERRRLLDDYVDGGGGAATYPATESETFLAFLEARLPDPSHALSLCRMDQALARARLGAPGFVPPRKKSAGGRVERGRHAALVWFHTDAGAIVRALREGVPPPLGAPNHAVLFGPGVATLFRLASAEEAALWARLPTADAAPDLVDRLLAEGVLTRSE